MFLTSRDLELAAAISPRALVGYLQQLGWHKAGDYGDNGAIYSSRGENKVELIIPLNSRSSDFGSAAAYAISKLADAHDISPYDILNEISIASFDVIKIRSPDADAIGSISIRAGLSLHEYARDMVIACANAAAAPQPRALWQGRPFEQVEAYLESVRLGQSQKGSFVISILSPWDFTPKPPSNLNLFDDPIPFGRQVTQMFARALEATQQAIVRSATSDVRTAFDNVVARGVSANFCDALSELARDEDGVDIVLRWSSATSAPQGNAALHLAREDAQILREAGQVLRERVPIEVTGIEGIIRQIKDDDAASFDGSVVLIALLEGRPRNVHVRFTGVDREVIFEAAKSKQPVRVTGQIQLNGKRLELINPHDLTTVELNDE